MKNKKMSQSFMTKKYIKITFLITFIFLILFFLVLFIPYYDTSLYCIKKLSNYFPFFEAILKYGDLNKASTFFASFLLGVFMLIAWITIFTLDTIYRHRNNIVTINNKNLIFWFIFSIFLSSFFIWVLYFMPILTASRRNVMMIEIMNSSLFFMWWHNVICYILIVFNIASIYAYFLEICIRIKNFFVANDKKRK